MNNTYTRMVIGECLSEAQLREYSKLFHEYEQAVALEVGFRSSCLLLEDGGNLAVGTTSFESRESCLRHHSSRTYRQFVAKTQHLLAGNFVVKIFRNDAGGGAYGD